MKYIKHIALSSVLTIATILAVAIGAGVLTFALAGIAHVLSVSAFPVQPLLYFFVLLALLVIVSVITH